MPIYRVVIDTNVLVAGLRSDRGASFRLLTLIGDPRVELNPSVPLVFEYEAVLKRPEAGVPLTHDEIDRLLDFWCRVGRGNEIFYLASAPA
ncbi:MAG TPA: PIN domain-containing protein [Longimicrobium sp.]|nr:PIN domain-containing protein [Longimicrobium sp.]